MNRLTDGSRPCAVPLPPVRSHSGAQALEGSGDRAARRVAQPRIGSAEFGLRPSAGGLNVIRSSIRTPVLAAALIGALPAWADLETGGNEHAAADLRRPDTASLHRAARTADLGSLKAALAAGVKVDAHDERGWTALMHAANENHSPLVEELLRAGADPDVQAPGRRSRRAGAGAPIPTCRRRTVRRRCSGRRCTGIRKSLRC